MTYNINIHIDGYQFIVIVFFVLAIIIAVIVNV